MKSVGTKIIALVLMGSLLSAVVVGTLSIRNAKIQIQEDSVKLMEQAMANSGQEIDASISRIQQSVGTMAQCVLNGLTDMRAFQTDAEFVREFTHSMENTLLTTAENTEGAITAYLRYNPEFTEPTSGLFLSRADANGKFEKLTPTDFSIYDKSDAAHVGWYYIPMENKAPTWMSPYLNENLQVYMVSYVVPLIKDGVSVGVLGMDIDFRLIQGIVDQTGIYETGYAFLADQDNRIMYHKALPVNEKLDDLNTDGKLDGLCEALRSGGSEGRLASYEYEGSVKMMTSMQLQNGMRLVLTAPKSEINASENRLVLQILASTAAAVVLTVLISLFIIRGIVRPIEELNQAAGKIAQGDLDVSVFCQSKDEIGALADSIRLTVERLKQYINYIREISGVLEEIARGNLVFELRYDYAGEFAIVKKAFLDISRSLNRTLLEISHASGQVTNGSMQVSSGAQALSQGATEQAASVQELSATVHEIADKVRQNAESAQEAFSLAKESGSEIEESNRQMARMGLAMKNIGETSAKINQIVETVETIASQTNILALNAAVEAARAGEAGKGFSVVASEVRSLATQVNEATKGIVQLVDNATSTIGEGIAIAGKAENFLKEVVGKSVTIEAKLQEIAEASQQQSVSIEQVNLGIEQISAVVQTNSATAQEEAATSEEMSSQAQILQDLIRQFRLEGGN